MRRAAVVLAVVAASAAGAPVVGSAAAAIPRGLDALPAAARAPIMSALVSDHAFVSGAHLSANDGKGGDQLGYSVAIDGSTIAVGARLATVSGQTTAGAIYVFTEGAGGWADATQTAKLVSSSPGKDLQLGWSVAIEGSTILGGAPNPNLVNDNVDCGTSSIDPGAVLVFTKPAGGWANATEAATLRPDLSGLTNPCKDVGFGSSVALSGTTAVVGAPYYGQGTNYPGAAFVFASIPTTGTVTSSTMLTAHDVANGTEEGNTNEVAIDGNTIVLGAFHALSPGGSYAPGRAYVFVKPASGWATATETAELSPSDGGSYDDFGDAVAIQGGTVAVGSPYHTPGNLPALAQAGAVYVFLKPASGWASGTQNAELYPSEPSGSIGLAVAMSGGTILAGGGNDNGSTGNGAVYTFTEPAAGWPASMTPTQEIHANPEQHGSNLGIAVALSGSTVVAGANLGSSPSGTGTGLVDVFVPYVAPPPPPSPSARLLSVAVKGTTASLKLSCTAAPCTLTAVLTTAEHVVHGHVVSVSAKVSRTAKKKVTVGTVKLTIAAGTVKTVKLSLNRVGTALRSKLHTLPTTLKVTLTTATTTGTIATKSVTFKAPKPTKH